MSTKFVDMQTLQEFVPGCSSQLIDFGSDSSDEEGFRELSVKKAKPEVKKQKLPDNNNKKHPRTETKTEHVTKKAMPESKNSAADTRLTQALAYIRNDCNYEDSKEIAVALTQRREVLSLIHKQTLKVGSRVTFLGKKGEQFKGVIVDSKKKKYVSVKDDNGTNWTCHPMLVRPL